LLSFSNALLADLGISAPGAGDFTWNAGSQNTYGWNFTVGSVALQVTGLGIWDADLDGLAAAHPVGLWSESGALLASTVVQSGAQTPLVGEFRLEQLPMTLTLVAGATYTIGAFYGGDDFLHASFADPPVSSPAIFDLVARFEYGSVLTRPTRVFGSTPYVGPTFEFTPVPEPSTVFFVFGIGVIMLARRFKKLTRLKHGLQPPAAGHHGCNRSVPSAGPLSLDR